MTKILRYVILPSPGDPFIVTYWWKYFRKLFENHCIDQLVVVINSPIAQPVKDYLRELFRGWPVNYNEFNTYLDHGTAIDRGLTLVPAQANVLLIEDDCIILDPFAIDQCFQALELTDRIVVSPRHSCSNEIIDVAKQRFGNLYAPCGEEGVNFWPNLFFAPKDVLITTDRWFNAKSWQAGDYYRSLDHKFKEFANGDTFVHASLQMRNNDIFSSMKPLTINQGHLHQHDDQFYGRQEGIWAWKSPTWVHIGSLSMAMNSMLLDSDNKPLCDKNSSSRSLDDLNPAAADIYQQAVFWCEHMYFSHVHDHSAVLHVPDSFSKEYEFACVAVAKKFDFTMVEYAERSAMYKEIGL